MKRKITPLMRNLSGFALFLLFMSVKSASTQTIPTNEWINLYSTNTQLGGKPVPVGAVIDAYDPDGVHCGTFTITEKGEYGFLFIYRDNALTPEVDEGALPGDTIAFKINGIPAKALGPNANIWTSNGDVLQVDLATNVPPIVASPIEGIEMHEDDPDRVIADLDTIFFDADNDSLIFSSASNVPFVKASIDPENQLIIALAPNWYGEARLIFTADDGQDIGSDTVSITVHSVNDPPMVRLPDSLAFPEDGAASIDLNRYVTDEEDPDSLLRWKSIVVENMIVIFDSTSHIAALSALDDWYGTEDVIFVAIDNGGASGRDTISVLVSPINDPPVILGIPDTAFANDATLTLDLNRYVHDVDDLLSHLQWTAEVEPGKKDSLEIQIDNNTNLAVFRAEYNFRGISTVIFTVTDDSLASDSDTLLIRVDFASSIGNNVLEGIPKTYSLSQNYPNPFNMETTIKVELPEDSEFSLRIYNLAGRLVKTLVDGKQSAGYYAVSWNGKDERGINVASGAYLYELKAKKFIEVRKMILLR